MKSSARRFLRAPGVILLALGTLILGISATIIAVSMADYIFRAAWAFTDVNRVFLVSAEQGAETGLRISASRYLFYRQGQTEFSGLAADQFSNFEVAGKQLNGPLQVTGLRTTANYFTVLGIQPLLGRTIRPDEESSGTVVLVSERFWRRELGGTPKAIGRVLLLNGVPSTIIGVLPTITDYWARSSDVWTNNPFGVSATERERNLRGQGNLRVIARLRPGTTLGQAKAGLKVLDAAYKAQRPDALDALSTAVMSRLPDVIVGRLRSIFSILMASSGCILALACFNVANLLAVDYTSRRREIAVRVAVGARLGHITMLLLSESLLLSFVAVSAGLALGYLGLKFVPPWAPDVFPQGAQIQPNGLVILFASGLVIFVALSIGLYPAWQSTKRDVITALRESGNGMAGGVQQRKLRNVLICAQAALSVLLLTCASLLLFSFLHLSQQNPGFESEGVSLGIVSLPSVRYADGESYARFSTRLIDKLRLLPNIQSASVSSDVPLTGGDTITYAKSDGNVPSVERRPLGFVHSISPEYFAVLHIPLVAGRNISDTDSAKTEKVVVISRRTSRRLFGGENPLDRVLLLGSENASGVPARIIGVVGDVRSADLARDNDAEFYKPFTQAPVSPFLIAVRSSSHQRQIKEIRTTLTALDPALPLIRPSSLAYYVAGSISSQRLMALMVGSFAIAAFIIAIVGIYAVVASTVKQRSKEIGIRIALGALPGDVLWLVAGQGMKPVVFGIGFGLICAYLAGKTLASHLYGITGHNPYLFAGTAIIFSLMSLLACIVPARSATHLDPVKTLRLD